MHGESDFPTGSLLDEIHKIEGSSPIFSLVSVPRNKPKIRRQFEEAKRMWPTAFHEDKKLEALLNGTYFSGIFSWGTTKPGNSLSSGKKFPKKFFSS